MDNLSHYVPGLLGSESEAATNTITAPPPFTPAGSVSESSAGVTAGTPGPAIPAPRERTVVHPSGAPRVPSPWRRADGSAWETSADQSSAGNAPAAGWEQQ